MDIAKKIEMARRNERERSEAWEREMAESRRKSEQEHREINDWLDRHARRVSGSEYNKWLHAYLVAKDHTHCYDYEADRWGWYELTKSGTIPAACGAMSVNIIVPANLSLEEAPGHSHNNIYYWRGLRTNRHLVPVFSCS
jgi:hypothetical protein